MHGDYAFIGSYGEGMVIADISDPPHPKRAGTFRCGGGSQYDVQLSNDGNLAVLLDRLDGRQLPEARASGLDHHRRHRQDQAPHDRLHPDRGRARTRRRSTTGSSTSTTTRRATRSSRSSTCPQPTTPASSSSWPSTGRTRCTTRSSTTGPDGRDPALRGVHRLHGRDRRDRSRRKPKLLQRIADPRVTISHQAEPSHDRKTLIVTDEFNGGGDAPGAAARRRHASSAGRANLPLVGDPTEHRRDALLQARRRRHDR